MRQPGDAFTVALLHGLGSLLEPDAIVTADLVRALWDGGGDRARGPALARVPRVELAAAGAGQAGDREAFEKWVRARGVR